MAALTRIAHKIFGLTGATSNFGKFGSAKTGTPVTTKDIATIMGLAAWSGEGWKDAVDGTAPAPALEEMNSAFYVHSRQLGYVFESGIPEWDAATTYYTGSVVRVGAYWYISLADNNLNNTPPAAASNALWSWANQPGVPAGVMADFGGITAPAGWFLCDGGTYSRSTYAALFAVTTVVKACNITNGSAVVTGIDTTAGFGVGQYVEGSGIQAGTRILTVDGINQITLNAPCTSSIATVMRMSPWGLGDGVASFNVPDFRRKVAYGAGAGVTAGLTGGAETVTLTAAQSGVPAHLHTLPFGPYAGGGGTGGGYNEMQPRGGTSNSNNSTPANAAQAHDNMPPYLVAAKIIKY